MPRWPFNFKRRTNVIRQSDRPSPSSLDIDRELEWAEDSPSGWQHPAKEKLDPPPTAVFFDMGHTLMIEEPSAERLFNQACKQVGLPVDIRKYSHRYEWLEDAVHAYRTEYISEFSFYDRILSKVLEAEGVDRQDPNLTAELWRRMQRLQKQSKRLSAVSKPTLALLHKLHDSGFTLGLISNWGSSFFSVIEVYNLAPIFDVALASEMVGISKPHPEIFLKGASMANCTAEEIIFVGDNYHYDGAGAREVGMRPIHFNVGLLHQARMAMSELKRGIKTTLLPPADVVCIDRLTELVPLLGLKLQTGTQPNPKAAS